MKVEIQITGIESKAALICQLANISCMMEKELEGYSELIPDEIHKDYGTLQVKIKIEK